MHQSSHNAASVLYRLLTNNLLSSSEEHCNIGFHSVSVACCLHCNEVVWWFSFSVDYRANRFLCLSDCGMYWESFVNVPFTVKLLCQRRRLYRNLFHSIARFHTFLRNMHRDWENLTTTRTLSISKRCLHMYVTDYGLNYTFVKPWHSILNRKRVRTERSLSFLVTSFASIWICYSFRT